VGKHGTGANKPYADAPRGYVIHTVYTIIINLFLLQKVQQTRFVFIISLCAFYSVVYYWKHFSGFSAQSVISLMAIEPAHQR
jgi:hypothetical protein